MRLLPLAQWALNDVPGPMSGYSPHRIIYGTEPVDFGDVPPTTPQDGRADAATFSKQLVKDCKMVRDKLVSIHSKEVAKFLKRHPGQISKDRKNVWVRFNRQGADRESTKLYTVWKGPNEVQHRVGSGRYGVITEKVVENNFQTENAQKMQNKEVATTAKLSVARPKTPSKVRVLGTEHLCGPRPQRERTQAQRRAKESERKKTHTNNNVTNGRRAASMLHAMQR